MKAIAADGKLIVPYRPEIPGFLPDARALDHNGKKYHVVPHGTVETKLLRNIGADVPSPILSQYDWAGGEPFESQKETAALLSTEPRAYCLSSMGVGKTRAALYAFDFLLQKRDVEKVLVIAPLSTLVDVWGREVFECFPHLWYTVLHGTKKQRLKALQQDSQVYIINHDGVSTILDDLVKMKFDVVIIDELGAFRNASTKRWKVLNQLVNKSAQPIVWGLTGSPTPNAPTDAFGLVKLLTPQRIGRSFTAFRQSTMLQVSQFRWVARKEANEIVANAMKPSIRFTLDECHDIPPTTYSMRHIEPTDTQKALYKRVLDHYQAEHKGQSITAVNEGAKLAKLLQISAGFAYSDGKGYYVDAKSRMKEVVELIEQANQKVLVFASFKWIIKALNEVISTKFSTAVVTGDTSKADRDRTFFDFRNSDHPRVIIAHAGTMAHGLTLVEADTIIWYGPTLSTELYEQANARIRRAGQTKHTHVICIESTPVEKKAFQRLQHNQKMQGMLLELFDGAESD